MERESNHRNIALSLSLSLSPPRVLLNMQKVQMMHNPRTSTLPNLFNYKRDNRAGELCIVKKFFQNRYICKKKYSYEYNNYDRRASDAFDVWPKLKRRL